MKLLTCPFQSLQEVPDWLQSLSSGGFEPSSGTGRGKFGARDVRSKQVMLIFNLTHNIDYSSSFCFVSGFVAVRTSFVYEWAERLFRSIVILITFD